MDSTKFLADDDVVVEAMESDAAVSWIADVSMVQQLGKTFTLMDNNSLFVDFDGRVLRVRTVDFPDHALGGYWGELSGVSWVYGEEMQREPRQVFCFSNSERRRQLGHKTGPC